MVEKQKHLCPWLFFFIDGALSNGYSPKYTGQQKPGTGPGLYVLVLVYSRQQFRIKHYRGRDHLFL